VDPEQPLVPVLAPVREPQESSQRQGMPRKFIPKECWRFDSMMK
jgi:hypothetical protein